MREAARGDKHNQRKAADGKAQICPVSGTNALLICALRPADFLTKCCWSPWEISRTISFSTSKNFQCQLDSYISMRRREEERCNCTFNHLSSVLRSLTFLTASCFNVGICSNKTNSVECFFLCRFSSLAYVTYAFSITCHPWLSLQNCLCQTANQFSCQWIHYRKRGSASYIVREVRSVREREIQREREREIDGSDVIIVALKLAMSLHFPMPKITAVSHPAFGEMATASSISRCQAVAMHMGHWTRTVRRSCTKRCLVWLSSLVDEEGSQTGRITVRALKYILWEEFFGIITTEWLEKFKFLRFAARTWDLR